LVYQGGKKNNQGPLSGDEQATQEGGGEPKKANVFKSIPWKQTRTSETKNVPRIKKRTEIP